MRTVVSHLEVHEMPEGSEIKAGTIVILPDVPPNGTNLPKATLKLVGQQLDRAFYPELSPIYGMVGGFYNIQVENLERRFLLGFDDEGKPILGSAYIYYESVKWDEIHERP